MKCVHVGQSDCGPTEPSLSVNQSTGSLAITEPFGAKVLGITCCGGKEETSTNLSTSNCHSI